LVTIVAKAKDGTLYTTGKEIDVSIGGCGGWFNLSIRLSKK
jgi:sulfur-oxidizing protein SoxY